jgi:hypothetical protein
MSLSALWSGMVIAHFGYQALTRGDWGYATDQSYAAGMALFCVWAVMKTHGFTFSRHEQEGAAK